MLRKIMLYKVTGAGGPWAMERGGGELCSNFFKIHASVNKVTAPVDANNKGDEVA